MRTKRMPPVRKPAVLRLTPKRHTHPALEAMLRGEDPPVQIARSTLAVKRLLDLSAGLALAVVGLPVALLAMALVRLTSSGAALYSQRRIGRGGRPFTIYKIRTMVDNCESLTGPRWCVPGDPRITPVGYYLRKLHIDELPQLWNVLRGDMSLIGPRPERPEFVTKLMLEVSYYDRRHDILPGITGLAQVQMPADTEVAHVERKIRFDLYYLCHLGLGMDLRILACTAGKVLGVSVDTLCRWMGVIRDPWFQPYGTTTATVPLHRKAA